MQSQKDPSFRYEIHYPPLDEKLHNEITRFHYCLKEELDQFRLEVDQIIQSEICILLYDELDKVCGICGYRKKLIAWSLFIVVTKEEQGKGLGNELCQILLQHTSPNRPLLLTVRNDNLKARGMYKRLGFVTVGREKSSVIMLWTGNRWKYVKVFMRGLLHIKRIFI